MLVADGRRPVSRLQLLATTRLALPRASTTFALTRQLAHAGDGPARAVEVASQLLPQLHGVFVCVVAPRHRVRDADLAAELAAALRAALPAATRVGAPRCMWLLANAKLERTLLCGVNARTASSLERLGWTGGAVVQPHREHAAGVVGHVRIHERPQF